MFVNPSRVTKWFLRIFSWPSHGQGQMSNTNNYLLEFLLTTYDITIVNETIQFTHIILQIDILQRNNEVKILNSTWLPWQRRFQLKNLHFYCFNIRVS